MKIQHPKNEMGKNYPADPAVLVKRKLRGIP